MSASCVGTCTACGRRTFWLSDTLCLQLDDGSLKCLPHPGESGACEKEGLSLGQASQRGRLFGEVFFVCRHCGRNGTLIERRHADDRFLGEPTLAQSLKLAAALLIVALICALLKWWTPAMALGITALICPLLHLRDEGKAELAKKRLPRPTAPGAHPIPLPTQSIDPEAVVGTETSRVGAEVSAVGPCCDHPDWMPAYRVDDADRIPCCDCRTGVMKTSEYSIH